MEAKVITCVDSCYWCLRISCKHRGEVGYKCLTFKPSKRLEEPVENDFTNFSETGE